MEQYALDGKNPLSYLGVRPQTPPKMFLDSKRPTENDGRDFVIGTIWVIPERKPTQPLTDPSEEFWFLAGKLNGLQSWKRLQGGGTPSNTLTVNQIIYDTPGSGTYIPSPGMKQCMVECVGGGGGSGATQSTASVFFAASNGGGSGAYAKKLFSAATIGSSQDFFVGAGGTAGSQGGGQPPSDGGSGGTTTFGTSPFITCTGGGGSKYVVQVGTSGSAIPSGGIATGGTLNINGQYGGLAHGLGDIQNLPAITLQSGFGASTIYGLGGQSSRYVGNAPATVYPATGFGSGASGSLASFGFPLGGNPGAPGLIIITEYIE